MRSGFYRWRDDLLELSVQLQQSACRNEIPDAVEHELRIRVAPPPENSRANRQLIRFLAKQFGVAQREVEIVSGKYSRTKRTIVRSPRRLPDSLAELRR